MAKVLVNRTDGYYTKRKNPRERMDDELTISHVLRQESSFTASGLPYARIVAKKLLEMKAVHKNARILEIGPGLGDFAKSFCSVVEPSKYVFLDISKDLIDNLKKKFRGDNFGFVTGDVLNAKINEKFDLVVCNEVLADLPTVVNMTMVEPEIMEEDREIYQDTVRMIEEYDLLPKGTINYGAIRFLERVKEVLDRNGTVFICEQASKPPKRILVEGHAEYTIDFRTLEKVSGQLGFRAKTGTMTKLLGVNDRKAVIFYMQPELKILYDFFKRHGVLMDQKAYEIRELLDILGRLGVSFSKEKYGKFLERQTKPFRNITDQFRYLILRMEG